MTWAPPRWGVALGWGAGVAAWTEAEVSVAKATNDARHSREQTVSKFEGRELTRDSRGFGRKTQHEPSLGGEEWKERKVDSKIAVMTRRGERSLPDKDGGCSITREEPRRAPMSPEEPR